ncbi:Polyubiquitin [Daldinia childiae]|uniref:Polyubiquitin n=1 Tax=Daldinia childiae TaxID=326645 RepID=UPI0014462177|nr:Polyubiquitin [Daldinia childiae]KAF3067219.1 Polyubiquitin [Daldinia childiae]
MPMGQGYSVEAQLTGMDVIGGLQFEITSSAPAKSIHLFLKTLAGKTILLKCLPPYTIRSVKNLIYSFVRVPVNEQRLISAGRELCDGLTLANYHIEPEATIHLCVRLFGGGVNLDDTPIGDHSMGVAAGGKIEQSIEMDIEPDSRWLKHMTMTIPVQILNSASFRSVTGRSPPPSPVTAATYAAQGLPFFDLPEEPSVIVGDFDAVKSVNEVDRSRGIAMASDESIHPYLISLGHCGGHITIPNRHILEVQDPNALINPAGPLRPTRTVADLKRELDGEIRVSGYDEMY